MENQEPWQINKDNIHWKILKGWLPTNFQEYLGKLAVTHQLNEEELLISIAEAIRKISYQALLILKKKTGREVAIPPFIISNSPSHEIAVIAMITKDTNQPEICLDRKTALEKSGPMVKLIIEISNFTQILRAVNGGLRCMGGANEFVVAYDFYLLKMAIEECLKNKLANNCYNFIKVVIEETLHYFDHQTDKTLIEKIQTEFKEISDRVCDLDEQARLKQAIEKKYGIQQRVKEIFEALKNRKDLFSPLLEKIQKSDPK